MSRPILIACCLLVGACAAPPAAPTPLPTLTLIPPTLIPTMTAVPLTPTVPPRTNPNDLLVTPDAAAGDETLRVPAVVRGLVQRAEDELIATLEVPRDAVQLIELDAAIWHSIDFGCGEERLPGVDNLEIPGYRLVFEVEGAVYAYHTNTDTTVVRCERPNVIVGETETLLEADPVAQELVALAQRRIRREREGEAVVVSVRAYTWPDTSMGCPVPGNQYNPGDVAGYRLVLAVDGETYIFHTSFDRLILCAPENESLPD